MRRNHHNVVPVNILVTGASGFIGARVADTLLTSEKNRVFCTDRGRAKDDLVKRGATFILGDLTDPEYCRRAAENINAIIHCAGLAGAWGGYQSYYRANVLATKNLLKAAKDNGAERFINISSSSIYFDFNDQLNLKEGDLPKKFSNAYAQTKWEAEELVRQEHGPNLFTVSLRPRSVIGAGDQNVLPRLMRLKEAGSLIQIGNGENIVDITTIGNLIDAIQLCLNATESAMGDVYNITNGTPIKFWDFVERVLNRAGFSTERKKLPYWPVMMAAKINEVVCRAAGKKKEPALLPLYVGVISFSMTMNIEKSQSKLGYQPRQSTEDGIFEFMDNWKQI